MDATDLGYSLMQPSEHHLNLSVYVFGMRFVNLQTVKTTKGNVLPRMNSASPARTMHIPVKSLADVMMKMKLLTSIEVPDRGQGR